MALDKLVDSTQLDNNLTSVANAIRARSGGTGPLAFPAGFVSEISNIPTGGGTTPTGTKEIAITENGTTTENVSGYAAVEITVNVSGSGGVKKTKNISEYHSYGTSIEFMSSINSLSPYTNYLAHVVFVNNTENTRAGVFVDAIKNANGFSGNVRRIGHNNGDFSWGVDVYAGASLDITFYPIE